ncbi:MAG: exodeoxyribonuclease VII large subunit [Pseudomonadales bacterium]|nr:exodeoxyribonuclease VII large subunit [Pseudomonadales bacterium]
MSSPPITEKKIYSVGELNRLARNLIESEFAQIWVEGEVSNFIRASSGHWYFSLKDEKAQVRCAMFSSRNRTLGFQPKDGHQIILRGKASIYEGRGDFQLIAENLMPAGEGLLQQQFEALKQKLEAQGLFSSDHKQPIPTLPRHIGIITSPTGAAIRDILTVLRRRFPAIPVTLIPTMVQGSGAAQQIIKAIELANSDLSGIAPMDVLILGRGGGSLEDLWCFNEEAVARAIYASKIPIISAVGHEIDFTIADFVADLRAPTPSAAAEMIAPDQEEWRRNLTAYAQYLTDTVRRKLKQEQALLSSLQKRLRHPGRQLQDYAQRLDYIETRMSHATSNGLKLRQANVVHLLAELRQHQPTHLIKSLRMQSKQMEQRLKTSIKQIIRQRQQQLQANAQALHTLSPLETLQRGYAIVMNKERQIVRSATSVKIGDRVTAQLALGQLHCSVDAIEP